jgi:hypothetical protein
MMELNMTNMTSLKALAIAAALAVVIMPAKAGTVGDYLKATREAQQNATRNLSLVPQKIRPDLTGVTVLFRIENKSDLQYTQVIWDCTAFFNSEPVGEQQLVVQDIPANGRVFRQDSYSFHEIDYSRNEPNELDRPTARASKTIPPSAFTFECRITWANDKSF